MPLCSRCQSLDVLNIPKLSDDWNRWPVTSKKYTALVSILNARLIDIYRNKKETTAQNTDPVGIPFHASLDELKLAAKDCAICAIVEKDVAKFNQEFEAQRNDTSARPELGGPNGIMYLARGVNDTGGFMVVSADKERDFRIWVVSAIGLCVDYDDPMGDLIRGRKMQNPANTLAYARNWVHDCDKQRTNTRCHVDGAALPARVLDVRSDKVGGVAMYESDGEIGRYAALSHVWGNTNPFTTTTANLKAHKEGIEMEKLPKTFSDAVVVARSLEIRYLWIDALCICPDDGEEWLRSSPKISAIYENAYILLSATGSSSDNQGLPLFDVKRPTPEYSSFSYTTTTKETTGTIHAFSVSTEVASYSGHTALLAHEPLSQRAWALQERWLAPRILHFSSTQILFECYCHFLSHSGFYRKGRSDTLFPSTAPRHSLSCASDAEKKQLRWQAVLNAYSRLTLTRPEDKLPALAGLARAFSQQLGNGKEDEYIAGLWRSTLLENLIWQAIGTTSPSPSSSYRAPSWSWAAIDGPFGLFYPDIGAGKGEWTRVATLSDCRVTLKEEANVFGEVVGAHLKLKAPLERLTPAVGEEESGFPNRQKGPRMKTETGSEHGAASVFDTPDHAERARNRELFALVLMRHFSSASCGSGVCEPRPYYHGIVVAEMQGKEGRGVYERLGKIAFGQDGLGQCTWMGGEGKGSMETVTLV